MADRYDVSIKVISQEGHCAAGHKEGDEWVMGLHTSEKPICLPALNAIFSHQKVLRYGGSFQYQKDPYSATVPCPDAANPVIFRLTRVVPQEDK